MCLFHVTLIFNLEEVCLLFLFFFYTKFHDIYIYIGEVVLHNFLANYQTAFKSERFHGRGVLASANHSMAQYLSPIVYCQRSIPTWICSCLITLKVILTRLWTRIKTRFTLFPVVVSYTKSHSLKANDTNSISGLWLHVCYGWHQCTDTPKRVQVLKEWKSWQNVSHRI